MVYKRKHPKFGGADQLKSGRWRVRYRYNGKQWSGDNTFLTQELAFQWLDKLQDDLLRNEWAGPTELSSVTFEEWARRWSNKPVRGGSTPKKPKTLTDYEGTFRLHVNPFIGHLTGANLDEAKIRRFLEDTTDKLEEMPVTLAKAQKYAKFVCKYMKDKGAYRVSPFDADDIFVSDTAKRREINEDITESDIEKLRDAFPESLRPAVRLAAYTGLRAGELWALKNRSISVLRKEMHITEACSEISGKGLVFHLPKNGKPRRVSLPKFILDELEEHMTGGPDDPLFKNQRGNQMRHSNFSENVWSPARKKLNVVDFRWHDLRHYCAVYHIGQGYDLADISALLGHSSISVTFDLYGGIHRARRDRMATSVDEAFRGYLSSETKSSSPTPIFRDTNVTQAQ